jgi:glycosyltransferase involved in cell wall biosynthesis
MKILITTSIFPPDIGGPARSVPLIASELRKRGHGVSVLTLSDSLRWDDAVYSFRVIRVPRCWLPLRLFWMVLHILREGATCDLLFVNGRFVEAEAANVFLRKPLVRKAVGDWAWEQATRMKWITDSFEEFQNTRYGMRIEFLRFLRNSWIRRAHKVIVDSSYLRHWLKEWGVSEHKITVIYNAVAAPGRIRPYKVPLSTSLKVVTVGRLERGKRVDEVIKVVSRMEQVGLVVVGDGPESGLLENLAHILGCDGRIYFAGRKDPIEVLALMAACDIFVLYSSHESFPHIVLEAMSVGLPVVATAVGGIPEIIKNGENGCLVPVAPIKALEEALMQLLSNAPTRQLLANGARQTAKKFAIDRMVNATERVLANSRTPAPSDPAQR